MSTTTFEHWKLEKLKNHHLNIEVFGEIGSDADCEQFVQSVKDNGVLQPCIVAPDGTIIAGHRRKQAAARAGLKEIDVIVRRDLKDQVSIDRAWFETNRNREMTTEQKARWFKKREAIEAEAAKSRQSKAGGSAPGKFSLSAGRASDIAAADVGMSGKTAKAAAKVVDAIDQAEANGNKEAAAKLRETLNNKSVSAAKREADKVSPPPKPRKRKKPKTSSCAKVADELSKKYVSPLVRGIDNLAEINGGKGQFHAAANDALDEFIKALKGMREGKQ